MLKRTFFITTALLVTLGTSAQLVSSSKLNPLPQNADTTRVSKTQETENTKVEVNSGTKTVVVTNEVVTPVKKEEEAIEPVNNTSSKNPK